MAVKSKKNKKNKNYGSNAIDPSDTSFAMDRLVNYSDLHFIPIDKKDEAWAAEVLYFNRTNSRQFLDPVKMLEKRDLDRNIIDANKYKQMIDPDGQAEHFSSDWVGNPLHDHLNKIIDAKLKKIPNNLMVKAVDEFSKSNQVKENERILGQREMRNLINEINGLLGFPPLKNSEDPFTYVKRMNMEPGKDGKVKYSKDIPMDIVDSVKSYIEDNDDIALFNGYLWKDGPEIACELGIDYYMNVLNRFPEISGKILRDIRQHNLFSYRFFTSETTGKPVLKYIEPGTVRMSEFENEDCSDIIHWYYEMETTFGDFIRMCGAGLDKDTLKAVFEKNKAYHGIEDYSRCGIMRRNAAKIRLGYMEFESQDLEVYTNFQLNGNERFRETSWFYQPSVNAPEDMAPERVEKNYNVWRSFYYIPTIASEFGAGNFYEQSKFIFKYGKLQDQQRYGEDNIYSKPSLVAGYSDELSFHDVQQCFMPMINLLWLQAKNDIVQAHPHGLIWFEEFLARVIANTDEKEMKSSEIKKSFIKMVKQTGGGVVKALDQEGKLINDGKPFVDVKTGHLDSATRRMESMMILYQMMTRALAFSETAEGVDPKPRQSFGGVRAAMEGTSNATYFIEEMFSKAIVMGGEKLLYYIVDIVNEKDTERFNELCDVVGKANGLALESIKDIPIHKLGLFVDNVITDEQKAFVNQIANQLAGAGLLDMDTALFLTTVTNLKYAYAILRLMLKKKQREQLEATQSEREFQLQLKKEDRDFELLKISSAGEIEFRIKEMMKQMDMKLVEMENMLKSQGQLVIKDKIKDNRVEEKLVDKKLEDGIPV